MPPSEVSGSHPRSTLMLGIVVLPTNLPVYETRVNDMKTDLFSAARRAARAHVAAVKGDARANRRVDKTLAILNEIHEKIKSQYGCDCQVQITHSFESTKLIGISSRE